MNLMEQALRDVSYKTMKPTGDYYGYPDCCIRFFSNRAADFYIGIADPKNPVATLDANQMAKMNGEGFVPCPQCAKKLVEENKDLSSLIHNRQCLRPFPEEENEDKHKCIL